MPALTRRRDRNLPQECWCIYYGDVHAGTIAQCVGNPGAAPKWQWRCGFYPGSRPGECTGGTADTLEIARVLGVDGISDFNALHSGKHNEEVQLCAFDLLALDGDDLRDLPLSMRKANLARLLVRRPDGIFVSDFEQGEIGPDLFRKACEFGLEGMVSKHRIGLIVAAGRSTGSK